jgi:hypothetical protein
LVRREAVPQEPSESPPQPGPGLPTIGLTKIDKLAANGAMPEPHQAIIDQVEMRVRWLASDDAVNTLKRMRARRIATLEVHIQLIEARLGTMVREGAWKALEHYERLHAQMSETLMQLMREHASEERRGKRSVVVVSRTEITAVEGY